MGDKRRIGGLLIAAAVVLAMAAWGWWLWENSDSQMYDREVDALAESFSSGRPYEAPDPPSSVPMLVLGAGAAVVFLAGMIFVAAPPDPVDPGGEAESDHLPPRG